jgi:hypothetical protein
MQYVTPVQLLTRLRSDATFEQPTSQEYDALLDEACSNATAIVNGYIGDGRSFAFGTLGTEQAPVTRIYTGDGSDWLFLDLPLRSFAGATTGSDTLTPADVWLEDANEPEKRAIVRKSGIWSDVRQNITVSGVWGWGDPPAEVLEAVVEIGVRIVKGRAAGYSDVIGIDGVGTAGDGTQGYVKALPPMIKLALDLLKRRVRSLC